MQAHRGFESHPVRHCSRLGISSLKPGKGATLRSLAASAPRTFAPMHGPSFAGDGAAALRALAERYDRRVDGARREDAVLKRGGEFVPALRS